MGAWKDGRLNLFIFGVGFSGIEIAKAAFAEGAQVAGTTRSEAKAARLAELGIEPFLFGESAPSGALAARLQTVSHLLISIGPDAAGDPALNAFGKDLSSMMPTLEWIGYLSTVGVYGDHDGAWVDEETQCKPVSERSVERLKAEAAWHTLADDISRPLAILRLSGIYGPGRNTFLNLEDGSAKRIIKPGQYFNRVHVADIAWAAMLLARRKADGLFNVTDSEPAPPQDVVTYAANLMGVPPPPETAYEDAKMSPMARSFYGEVKRVSNAKIRNSGYEFIYPNYRAALADMWQNGRWR
jgi:nucleoside-diphosphate-sugar epimerase